MKSIKFYTIYKRENEKMLPWWGVSHLALLFIVLKLDLWGAPLKVACACIHLGTSNNAWFSIVPQDSSWIEPSVDGVLHKLGAPKVDPLFLIRDPTLYFHTRLAVGHYY